MKWILLWLALAFATHLWLCLRVGKSSVALAVATFFLGPLAALYTLFKHHGDGETSITVPFVANLVVGIGFAVVAWQVLWPMMQAAELERYGMVAGMTAPAAPAAVRSPAAASATVPAAASGPDTGAAAASGSTASGASAPATADVVEMYAQTLREAGLQVSVSRAALPPGVAEVAIYSVTTLGNAAASGPPGAPYIVTLYRCETLAACRSVAGSQMQLSGADRRRMLQNGLLILSTPAPGDPVAGEADLTPTAVASAFRKLQP